MPGFTYDTYVAAVETQIPTIAADPNFQTMLPVAISYGEQTINRDMDFLVMHALIQLPDTVVGGNTVAVPNGVQVLESLFLGSEMIPLTVTSQPYIRTVYGGAPRGAPAEFCVTGTYSGIAVPAQYLLDGFGNPVLDGFGNPIVLTPATFNPPTPQWGVLYGPTSDAVYSLTGYGTQQEQTLSAAYPQTYISTYYPDLFWAATMIFWSGYNRNFGSQADDPRQALSWLAEYQRILKSADKDEDRKQFQSNGWTAYSPTPLASPRT